MLFHAHSVSRFQETFSTHFSVTRPPRRESIETRLSGVTCHSTGVSRSESFFQGSSIVLSSPFRSIVRKSQQCRGRFHHSGLKRPTENWQHRLLLLDLNRHRARTAQIKCG